MRPDHDEQSLPIAHRICGKVGEQRSNRLLVVTGRLARLEGLAADQAYCTALAQNGRHLRLSAAIAWASGNVDLARARIGICETGVAARAH